MNDIFETLSEVFEELRSESDDREYSVQIEEAKQACKELKKKNPEYEKFLLKISPEDKMFLDEYMEILEHAHFQEEQRAYYQGMVDAVQIFAGLGMIKPKGKIKELLKRIAK